MEGIKTTYSYFLCMLKHTNVYNMNVEKIVEQQMK